MPFGRLIQEDNPSFERLRERLRQEWAGERQDDSGPVIIESTDHLRPQVTPTHLYVIWDAWHELSQRERSKMVMEVYEAVRGLNMARNVTVAMGLSPKEAERMNIRYAPASPSS